MYQRNGIVIAIDNTVTMFHVRKFSIDIYW